ncbi:MAG: S4 domain-containing protein [Nitrososphaerota archaeon]
MTHVKSLAAPRHYPQSRGVFVASPSPGPHPASRSLPLIHVVRDILELAEDARTARILIREGNFYVDGRPVRDVRFPLGLMDVLYVKELDEYYRILIRPSKGLRPMKIMAAESSYKVCQVKVKKMAAGARLLLGLHDGRSILLPGESDLVAGLSRLDSLKISVPSQEIIDIARMVKGTYVLIHSGSKQGYHGKLLEIVKDVTYPAKPTVAVETSAGLVKTILSNVMPVGVDMPWIALP